DYAGQGLGRWLLAYAEQQAPQETTTFSLFTGHHSDRNIAIYQRAGYDLVDRDPNAGVVHLTKALATV
ncbi:GNAT family N-acetyltransferase, partial [Kibdelosporangium lantanae]